MAHSIDDVLAQLRWRYATKRFDPTRKIAPELWEKIEDAMILAPSTFGLQPWKIVVVTDPAVREQLSAAAYRQPQITAASHLVVFAVKKGMGPDDATRLIDRIAEQRGVSTESLAAVHRNISLAYTNRSPEAVDIWMSRQVMLPLGIFLSTAAMIGVDACPMEGFEPAKFDEILGLRERGYGSVVIATAGYRAEDDKYASLAKVRFAKAEVIENV